MLKQQQNLQQTLKLSPKQIQLVRMLELPVLELEERVKKELEENPTLEEGEAEPIGEPVSEAEVDDDGERLSPEEIDLDDYRNEDDIPDYKLAASTRERDERRPEYTYTRSSTFHEQLLEQIDLKELSPEVRLTARYLVGNLDDNGYLTRTPASMADDMAFTTGYDPSMPVMLEALAVVQELDPPGVGAADLRECLLLQLERKRGTDAARLAYSIIDKEFEAFTKRHFDRLMRVFKCTDKELRDALTEIQTLNPKPGGGFGDVLEDKMEQIVPDFIVETVDGELVLALNNGNIPPLHVNNAYADLVADRTADSGSRSALENREARSFVRQKLDEAQWFIDALKQRDQTMTRTMEVILDIQRDFFLTGDESRLRPMVLRDVAERTGYDISTISRVSNSKYVQTVYGLYPLRYFFSTEAAQNASGEEVSSREVKAILASIIAGEDKQRPYSDDKLSELLAARGYTTARRTVAKYREQMGLPVARLRKEI